jgi:hypothetical protein
MYGHSALMGTDFGPLFYILISVTAVSGLKSSSGHAGKRAGSLKRCRNGLFPAEN